MAANKKSFDTYAWVRAARQSISDRIEEIKAVDWKDSRLKAMDKAESDLINLESLMEQILKEDQV